MSLFETISQAIWTKTMKQLASEPDIGRDLSTSTADSIARIAHDARTHDELDNIASTAMQLTGRPLPLEPTQVLDGLYPHQRNLTRALRAITARWRAINAGE